MADPKVDAELTKFLSGFFDQMENTVRIAVRDAYRLGYSHGDRDAIARVLKVAQPKTSSGYSPQSPSGTPQGAATHQLISLVLAATVSATPAEIERSSANTGKITRAAINKALKRGAKNGFYANNGEGRYSLKETIK